MIGQGKCNSHVFQLVYGFSQSVRCSSSYPDRGFHRTCKGGEGGIADAQDEDGEEK